MIVQLSQMNIENGLAVGRVMAVHVGRPRTVVWHGREVTTAIFKGIVSGRISSTESNLVGDGQADVVHHGGSAKAIYAYPYEHYGFWRDQLGYLPDGTGVFGENLTIVGIDERHIHIGDVLGIGTLRMRVTEPRFPCFKLGIRLEKDDIVDRFIHANRTGFYLAIEQPGSVAAGDTVRLISQDPHALSVAELMRLRALSGSHDADRIEQQLTNDAVTSDWRTHLRNRLDAITVGQAPAWPGLRRFVVTHRHMASRDVVSLHLRARDGSDLVEHRPGQFVTVELPGPPALRRCYSLHSDTSDGTLQIAVKRAQTPRHGAASWQVQDLGDGDEILLRAPAGSFTPHTGASRPLVLVAGGIGVTPVHAIAQAVHRSECGHLTWPHFGRCSSRILAPSGW